MDGGAVIFFAQDETFFFYFWETGSAESPIFPCPVNEFFPRLLGLREMEP